MARGDYSHLPENGQRMIADIRDAIADEEQAERWVERFVEAITYLGHPAINVGMTFAMTEAVEGHYDHAEKLWEALSVGMECISQRMLDKAIPDDLSGLT